MYVSSKMISSSDVFSENFACIPRLSTDITWFCHHKNITEKINLLHSYLFICIKFK
jgi:hypothetical protein